MREREREREESERERGGKKRREGKGMMYLALFDLRLEFTVIAQMLRETHPRTYASFFVFPFLAQSRR
jgi:hypothetical protein